MTARGNSRLRIPITVVRANFGVIRSKRKVVGSIQMKNPGLDLLTRVEGGLVPLLPNVR